MKLLPCIIVYKIYRCKIFTKPLVSHNNNVDVAVVYSEVIDCRPQHPVIWVVDDWTV